MDLAGPDLTAVNLGGAVGDDLVGVHVRGRARPSLKHVDGELVVVLAGDDLVGGLDDGFGLVVGDGSQVAVGQRGRLLDDLSARTKRRPKVTSEMGKFSTARWVWAPQ